MALMDWQKKALVRNHPFFAKLINEEIETFANIATEVHIAKGKAIVTQGDPVDSVYLIASGKAEVQHIEIKNGKEERTPLAILNEGEGIGLSDVGLYSKTGKRTATVIALAKMVLLKITLAQFNQYIHSTAHIDEVMQSNEEMLARINLIKRTISFANLTDEQISWFASRIQIKNVKSGEIIYKKGDTGKDSYLIFSGQVEILDEEKRIALLEPQNVFGESNILMNLPAGHAAKAVTDSSLLSFSQELFYQAAKIEINDAVSLLRMRKADSPPVRISHIESFETSTDDKEPILTIKDKNHETYIKVNQQGRYIWECLDGTNRFQDIVLLFYAKFKIYKPELIANFLVNLEKKGFISINKLPKEKSVHIMSNQDFFVKYYQRGLFILYRIPLLFIYLVLSTIGAVLYFYFFGDYVEQFGGLSGKTCVGIFVIALILFRIQRFFRGIAEGFTLLALGHVVKSAGIIFSFFGAKFYCDRSEIWISNTKQKLLFGLSGIFFDFITAGFLSVMIFFIKISFFALTLWMLTLFCYLAVLFQLAPYARLDGCRTWQDIIKTKALLQLKSEKNQTHMPRRKSNLFYRMTCLIYYISFVFLIFRITDLIFNYAFNINSILYTLLIAIGVALLPFFA